MRLKLAFAVVAATCPNAVADAAASATTTPADYTLLQSAGGENGGCLSDGKQLPILPSAGNIDLTACSFACSSIEECVAFGFSFIYDPPANCQLIGIDMLKVDEGIDQNDPAYNWLSRNDWANVMMYDAPFDTGFIGTVDTVRPEVGIRCYVKVPPPATTPAPPVAATQAPGTPSIGPPPPPLAATQAPGTPSSSSGLTPAQTALIAAGLAVVVVVGGVAYLKRVYVGKYLMERLPAWVTNLVAGSDAAGPPQVASLL